MRYAKRIDANQHEIVTALRDVGAMVTVCSHAGRGLPDILVTHRGDLYPMEIKNGKSAKLTKAEKREHAKHGMHIVRSVDEALNVIGVTIIIKKEVA